MCRCTPLSVSTQPHAGYLVSLQGYSSCCLRILHTDIPPWPGWLNLYRFDLCVHLWNQLKLGKKIVRICSRHRKADIRGAKVRQFTQWDDLLLLLPASTAFTVIDTDASWKPTRTKKQTKKMSQGPSFQKLLQFGPSENITTVSHHQTTSCCDWV